MLGIPPLFRGMAKLKPIPMPIEAVLHSRHMAFASGPLERAIWTIACRFWASGAKLGALDEATACQVAKIQGAHWERLKAPIMAALADILPDLATRYAKQYATREHFRAVLRENGARGRAIAMARHKARKEEANGKPSSAARVALKTPQVAAKYVNPRACMAAQALADLDNSNVESARFLDK